MSTRIDSLVREQLVRIGATPDGWDALFRDLAGGRLWEQTYQSGESHGGGSPRLAVIAGPDAARKYGAVVPSNKSTARRRLGFRVRLICVALTCGLASGCVSQPRLADRAATQTSYKLSGSSPHGEALRLVLERCGPEIDALDKAASGPPTNGEDSWWFDTIERAWTVIRPFGPAYYDSTHWFAVQYEIDGKVVATWSVDTRERTVSCPGAATQPSP